MRSFAGLFISTLSLVLSGCTFEANVTKNILSGSSSPPVFTGNLDDGALSTSLTTSPTLDWLGLVSDPSLVDHYEVAVGSSSGATDVLSWISVGTSTTYSLAGLSLTSGNQYFTSVRAVGKDGSTSAPAFGDGWIADPNPLKATASKVFITEGDSSGLDIDLTLPAAINNSLSCTAQVTGDSDTSDFVGFPSSFTFSQNTTTKTISLVPADDSTVENLEESFSISIDCGTPFVVTVTGLSIRDNELRVTAMYPTNGANWNDYVNFKVAGIRDYLSADDVACTGGTVFDCFHGGELRTVLVYEYDTCTNLSMEDSEAAFDWTCVDKGDHVQFWSKLKSKKGLQYLIDFTAKAWKPMSVTLKESASTIRSSTSVAWWSNAVKEAPTSAGTTLTSLPDAGNIYLISANATATGYQLSSAKSTLVIKNGVTLTSNGALVDAYKSFISLQAKYQWVEGKIVGHSSNYQTIDISILASLSQAHNFEIVGGGSNSGNGNVYLQASAFVKDGIIRNSGFSGLTVRSPRSIIQDVDIIRAGGYGIYGWLSLSPSLFHRVRVINSTIGVTTCAGTLLDSFVINGGDSNMGGPTCGDSFVLDTIYVGSELALHERINAVGLTSAFSSTSAISALGGVVSLPRTLHNLLAVNSVTGLNSMVSDSTLVSDLFSYGNATGISIPSGTGLQFTNSLKLGSNTTNCSVTSPGANPGLINTSCANQGPSDATLTTGLDIASSFYGKVSDSVNGSSAGGSTAAYSVNLDWNTFESWFRGWGKNSAGAFPQTASRGLCTSGTCAIYDWRLNLAADGALEDFYGTPVNGAACPAAAQGDVVATTPTSGVKYLLNAVELIDDSSGNDNGLCESNEACVFNRHIGGFQSEDIFTFPTQTCQFADSTGSGVTGVTMYFR